MAFLQQGIMASLGQPPTAPTAREPRTYFSSKRAQRQLGLFFAGAGFSIATLLITRRALIRRYKATLPKFYHPSNGPGPEINGSLEAAEALSLATINVFSVGMMGVGGLLYAFDISTVADMRRDVRSRMGLDGIQTDQEAEEEIEELFASILEKKLGKDTGMDIANKAMELAKKNEEAAKKKEEMAKEKEKDEKS